MSPDYGVPMNQQQPYQGWYSQYQQPPQQQPQQPQQPQSPMGMGMGGMGGSGKSGGGMGVPMGMGVNPLMTNQIPGGNPLMRNPSSGMNGSNPLQRNPGGLIPGYGPTEQSVTMNTNPMNNMNYAQNAFLGGMPGAGQILDQRYQAAYGPGGYAGPWTANG